MANKFINKLNDLSGKDWLVFTRSWFLCDSHRYHKNKNVELHPARYPEEMVAEFLRFFTKKHGWVLDPFAGSGATLVACAEEERMGVGIELSPRYAELITRRQNLCDSYNVICGDSRDATSPAFWAEQQAAYTELGLPFSEAGLPIFDFSISSPPYGAMLHTSRGHVHSKQKQRADQGLDTAYSFDMRDVGNIPDHETCVAELATIYRGAASLLKPDGYLVIVIQNYRAPSGEVIPLAWDLQRALKDDLLFQGERIWCQNTKPLGIWGYPVVFVPNYHHHYCLIFRNRRPPRG